ncbi:GFA family protein [Shewanella sp. TC10]|uniref:GFA family protein n=1 Tax=Shewanella sp. TC10 TaxID=1419739 RepID=UPI00129E8B0B|nr:GFA family protein [Shewanella sp. TC10]
MVNLTEVDGVEVMPKHRASCHCGSVVMELSLSKGLQDVRRCDCSMCRRRGAIVASINLDDIQFIQGEHELNVYQFNTKTAKHYFCRHCGIYTHHQRRSNPNQFGFNVACLAGINPLKIDQIKLYDGVNHPADR